MIGPARLLAAVRCGHLAVCCGPQQLRWLLHVTMHVGARGHVPTRLQCTQVGAVVKKKTGNKQQQLATKNCCLLHEMMHACNRYARPPKWIRND
jgi:hypothetical protein